MQAVDREKDTVICDLDGTIALDIHRAHHLHPPHKEGCAQRIYLTGNGTTETDGLEGPRVHTPCNCGWKRDWATYFSLCGSDEPNWPVIGILRLLWKDGYNIRILTGRSLSVRDVTEEWLLKHAVPYHTLIMRAVDSRIDDHILKPKWAEEKGYFPSNTLVVFEDRQRVVDAWRAKGYSVFQVAPGNF